MAHNARRYADSVYVTGYVVTGDDFKFFDTNITKAINGDGGGTWNPASAIVIGGAGMVLALAASFSGTASVITATPSSRLVHGDNDYVLFTTTRSIVSSALAGVAPRAQSNQFWSYAGSLQGQSEPTVTQNAPLPTWSFPLRVHDGAAMSSVTFKVALGTARTFRTNPIRVRVVRVDKDGNASPIGTVTDPEGYVAFAGNNAITTVQDIAYACNETIDSSRFGYRAEIQSEYGFTDATTPRSNSYFGATGSFSLADMRPQ